MATSMRRVCHSFFLLFVAFVISDAYQFNVGGRAGWVVNPPESYNTWAGRMRFQVNDTLLFKYNQGSNAVLEVNGNDFSQCNTNNPIMKMEDGNSIFTFNRTGPFYFISGNKTLCDQGQKLIVVVLALRNGPPLPSPPLSPTPSPATSPESPPAPAPGGAVAPSTSPAPGTISPPTTPSSDSPPGTPSTPGSVTPPAGGNSSSGASFTATSALMSAVTIILCMTLSA